MLSSTRSRFVSATRSAVLGRVAVSGLVTPARVSVRAYARGALEDRGRALEDRAVREHDALLLQALRKSLENARAYHVVEGEGAVGTEAWRLYVTRGDANERVSAWHDVPLSHDSHSYNFIVEMPKK